MQGSTSVRDILSVMLQFSHLICMFQRRALIIAHLEVIAL